MVYLLVRSDDFLLCAVVVVGSIVDRLTICVLTPINPLKMSYKDNKYGYSHCHGTFLR